MSSSRARLSTVFWLCLALGFFGGRVAAAGPENVMISRDTDGNGIEESYQLADKQVTVREGQQMIWESPEEWNTEQILLADADNDGREELLMILWKYGSYGDVKPFWREQGDRAYSCHLFLYRLQSGRMKAVWCSSALEPPIESISVNTDPDRRLSLVAREQSRLPFFNPRSTWQWQDWGFTRI